MISFHQYLMAQQDVRVLHVVLGSKMLKRVVDSLPRHLQRFCEYHKQIAITQNQHCLKTARVY
jgi:hypothetical protein